MSLTALLMSCTLLIVVLGATLTMFEGFSSQASDATRRTDAQDAARTAADSIARALRNLASPTPDQPQAVDFAGASDLIFKTVDPAGSNATLNATNTKRVRYCLDTARQLREQTQTWTSATVPAVPGVPAGTAVPAGMACPASASGWTTTIAARSIVNIDPSAIVNGAPTPIFSYDSSVLTDISQIHVELLVDTDTVRLPPATSLSTGVFLRNQNRRPTALFATPTKTSGGFVLNGSASSDPEGDALRYVWCDGSVTVDSADLKCADGTKQVGTGITFTYTAAGVHQMHLEVADPAGLTGVSDPQPTPA